jgi:hypothetical protein
VYWKKTDVDLRNRTPDKVQFPKDVWPKIT